MKRSLILLIMAVAFIGASMAGLFAAPVNKLFDAAEKFQQAYPSAVEPGEPPLATFSRALIESPNAGGLQVYDAQTKTLRALSAYDLPVYHNSVTASIVSTTSGTATVLVPATAVPAGKKLYVTGFAAKVNGATAWTTTTSVKIQDTNGTPVDYFTIAVAALTGNAELRPGTANVTSENAYILGTGGTAAKGLQVKANANAGAGSNLVVTVFYVIR